MTGQTEARDLPVLLTTPHPDAIAAVRRSTAVLRARRHGRLDGVQYLRALAAVTVTMSHVMGDIVYHGGPNLFGYYYVGAAGVDLFFVISGFVMIYTADGLFGVPGGAAGFLRKRLARIVPVYWLATLAYALVQVGKGNWVVVRPDLMAASLVFWPYADAEGLHLPVYSIGWTLDFEMMFYAVFAAGLLLHRRRGLTVVVGGLLGLVALGSVLTLPQPLRFWSHPILLEFLLGLGLGQLYLGGWRLTRRWAAAAAGLAAALFVVGAWAGFNSVPNVPESFPRWVAWGIPAALVVGATVVRDGPPGRPRPWLLRLGAASYALYLVHPLIVIGVRPLLFQLEAKLHVLPAGPIVAALIYVAILLTAIIAGAVATHVWIEKPLLHVLGGGRSRLRREA